MKKIFKREEGFTIIEVVLVLAIAGLIFLVVFLALPQLQRSRRDTARRGSGGQVVASIESFASNNNGDYSSADAGSFTAVYITDKIQTPDGTNYAVTFGSGVTPAQDAIIIAIGEGTNCSGVGNGPRDVAVRVGLEQGVYCQDNK